MAVIWPVLLCLSEFFCGPQSCHPTGLAYLGWFIDPPPPFDDALAPTAESVKALSTPGNIAAISAAGIQT